MKRMLSEGSPRRLRPGVRSARGSEARAQLGRAAPASCSGRDESDGAFSVCVSVCYNSWSL